MALDVTGSYRYPDPSPEWLASRVEEVIAPEIAIIDAHHHLWIENKCPYLLDEIAADVGDGHRIEATVFVQAHFGYDTDAAPHLAPVGETRKVAAIARDAARKGFSTDIAAAIVAYVDLTGGDRIEEALDAHSEAADGRFRGVRHSVSNDPHFPNGIVIRPAPAGLLAEVSYRRGLARLAARGLTYDAMLYHIQIPELVSVARALPDLAIVLDHIGCPLGVGPYQGREGATFAVWRQSMAELAQCPNVAVKLGGLGMIVTGARWHESPAPPGSADLATAWRPQLETCIDLFGAARCMFESNFPVDKAMYSYRTLWNAFKRLTAGASADERFNLFAGTAAQIYAIDAIGERAGVTVHG